MRILVIEDERKVANALKKGLEAEHYAVDAVHSGEEGFYLLSAGTYDLVLLDLMLPGRTGLEVLRTLRQRTIKCPVLILTAKDMLEDRVAGLDAGADDYMVKPFAFPELLARIRALVRRGPPEQMLRLKVGDLELDRVTRRVLRAGVGIDLTAREYELLEFLMGNQGQVVTRQMLAQGIWRESVNSPTVDNVIDVHITRLRAKIDEPFDRRLLRTIRGVGFRLAEEGA